MFYIYTRASARFNDILISLSVKFCVFFGFYYVYVNYE